MPDRLSRRATVLLVALAFALTFNIQIVLSDGSSVREPQAAQTARAVAPEAPAAEPELRLVAAGTVPALREPRRAPKPRARPRKRKPSVRKVATAAPRVQPAPMTPAAMTPAATAPPAPTAAPPPPQPQPQPQRPKPIAPKPAPAPTSAPAPTGVFDTSGEP